MRLVGYYEYGNALQDLDKLIEITSEEELYEIDEMVAEKDEFTVYTNLSRKLKTGPTRLNEPLETDRERRGLRWVTALARVELGAMLAGFTDVPKPFEAVANPKFDMEQYQDLLLDGARTHYWALANDPALPNITKARKVNLDLLSYSRRLVMARGMLRAAVNSNIDRYDPSQLRELSSWKESLDVTQNTIIKKIRSFQTSSEPYMSRYCGAILAAERREIAAGTATSIAY